MTGNVALDDIERLLSLANSERPLVALPARRQIIDWAKARDNFDSDEAFERATLLASSFCRMRSTEATGLEAGGMLSTAPRPRAPWASTRIPWGIVRR